MSQTNEEYKSLDEILSLVMRFETCEIEPKDFSHGAHITVAVWYLTQSDFDEAEKKMKEGLFRFLSHYKLEGYNETITIFWLKFLKSLLKRFEDDISLVQVINETVKSCADSRIIFRYYSKEFVDTDEAKTSWVEPDLKCFDLY